MLIGKIVKSESHINYICHINGPYDSESYPRPEDYAFGRFVRVLMRARQGNDLFDAPSSPGGSSEPTIYVVGVIYDTILQNPAFGTLGPRLSNETQVEIFSPDYINEKAVLVYIMVLGMMEMRPYAGNQTERYAVTHGIPPLALELECEIETMDDEQVRAFHFFRDITGPDNTRPYLHMGYLPHIIAQRNSLLPMVTLRIIEQLERLFPQNLALLSIVKRNFAWRLKVETAG